MARKSRKNMPAAETSSNLTAQAVMELGQEVKPYRAAIYARLSFESEANKERDTVETQIAYIKDFIDRQDDMAAADVYADVSVTGTTFDRPEFDRMMQDIRAGIRSRIDKWDLIKLQSFCKAKDTVNKTKRTPTDWERIFTKPKSNRG